MTIDAPGDPSKGGGGKGRVPGSATAVLDCVPRSVNPGQVATGNPMEVMARLQLEARFLACSTIREPLNSPAQERVMGPDPTMGERVARCLRLTSGLLRNL